MFRELEVRIKREEARRKAEELGLEEEEVQHAANITSESCNTNVCGMPRSLVLHDSVMSH